VWFQFSYPLFIHSHESRQAGIASCSRDGVVERNSGSVIVVCFGYGGESLQFRDNRCVMVCHAGVGQLLCYDFVYLFIAANHAFRFAIILSKAFFVGYICCAM